MSSDDPPASGDNTSPSPPQNQHKLYQKESKGKAKHKEYTVERIVKKRNRANKIQYLVKWQGYSDAENTWEDEENLINCKELLKEFNKNEEFHGTNSINSTNLPPPSSSNAPTPSSGQSVSFEPETKKRSLKDVEGSFKKKDPVTKRPRKPRDEPSPALPTSNPNPTPVPPTPTSAPIPSPAPTPTPASTAAPLPLPPTPTAPAVGFEHGDRVKEIIGARVIKNVLHLYVQWKGKNVCTFVPAEVCNKKIPQKVIQFYESRIKFEKPVNIG